MYKVKGLITNDCQIVGYSSLRISRGCMSCFTLNPINPLLDLLDFVIITYILCFMFLQLQFKCLLILLISKVHYVKGSFPTWFITNIVYYLEVLIIKLSNQSRPKTIFFSSYLLGD